MSRRGDALSHEQLLQLAQTMRAVEASVDAILAALRVEGASQADSVRVLRKLEGARLGVAKELLDQSPVWADKSDLNETIRTVAVESLYLGPER